MPPATLVLVNPHAGGGRAGRVWAEVEPIMRQTFPALTVATTTHPDEIIPHLKAAQQANIEQVIAVGGDGTSHSVLNALLKYQLDHPDAPQLTLGQFPIGTGQDFARTLGIPGQIPEIIRWLAETPPQFIDVGWLEIDGVGHYFLNIASVGISGQVDQLVSRSKRYPWTFLQRTVQAFLSYTPPLVKIKVDSEDWYEGTIWLLAVANGSTFGRGMAIAPDARPDDGLFEVVLVKGSSRFTALRALGTVYTGEHVHRPEVLIRRGQEIQIIAEDVIPLDLDGEAELGKHLYFKIYPQALKMIWKG